MTLLDIPITKTRLRGTGIPPVLNPHEGETPAEVRSREFQNRCISEWYSDRRDLERALAELELLRQAMPMELLMRITKLIETEESLEQQKKDLKAFARLGQEEKK
jgi:hypothetical protein